jgi:catechol 2,3-dioxygenase-like lactoylglutathione lyase family enzyme
MISEPVMDIAHLGHVERLTPKPAESAAFFTDVLGMIETARRGQSVYLRAWDDYEHHCVKLTQSEKPGIGHFAFRCRSPQALQRRIAALHGTWHDDELGHGPAFRTQDPDGHALELYYETEWYTPPPALKPALKNQAQRFPARGVNVRRLDHVNCLAVDIRATRLFIKAGPHKHAIQQTFFLYVYEPGGNRIEIANAAARLILAPDWKPIRWCAAERARGQAWACRCPTVSTATLRRCRPRTDPAPTLPSAVSTGHQAPFRAGCRQAH